MVVHGGKDQEGMLGDGMEGVNNESKVTLPPPPSTLVLPPMNNEEGEGETICEPWKYESHKPPGTRDNELIKVDKWQWWVGGSSGQAVLRLYVMRIFEIETEI